MKTVIIDEHEVVHMGVREFVAKSSFEIVAHCHTLSDYSQFMADHSMVDLILTEATIDGLELKQVIESIQEQSGEAKLIVFSEFDDPSLIQRAEELGADGFILKSVTSREFIDKLEDLQREGNIWTTAAA